MFLYRTCSREEYDIIERDKSFQNVGTRGEFFLLLNQDKINILNTIYQL